MPQGRSALHLLPRSRWPSAAVLNAQRVTGRSLSDRSLPTVPMVPIVPPLRSVQVDTLNSTRSNSSTVQKFNGRVRFRRQRFARGVNCRRRICGDKAREVGRAEHGDREPIRNGEPIVPLTGRLFFFRRVVDIQEAAADRRLSTRESIELCRAGGSLHNRSAFGILMHRQQNFLQAVDRSGSQTFPNRDQMARQTGRFRQDRYR